MTKNTCDECRGQRADLLDASRHCPNCMWDDCLKSGEGYSYFMRRPPMWSSGDRILFAKMLRDVAYRWKRDLLANSGKPTVSVPRQPVDNRSGYADAY